jgi:hypothetical protein
MPFMGLERTTVVFPASKFERRKRGLWIRIMVVRVLLNSNPVRT